MKYYAKNWSSYTKLWLSYVNWWQTPKKKTTSKYRLSSERVTCSHLQCLQCSTAYKIQKGHQRALKWPTEYGKCGLKGRPQKKIKLGLLAEVRGWWVWGGPMAKPCYQTFSYCLKLYNCSKTWNKPSKKEKENYVPPPTTIPGKSCESSSSGKFRVLQCPQNSVVCDARFTIAGQSN